MYYYDEVEKDNVLKITPNNQIKRYTEKKQWYNTETKTSES